MTPNEGESAKDFLARRKRSRAPLWSFWFSVAFLLGSGCIFGFVLKGGDPHACDLGFALLLMGMMAVWGYGKESIEKHIGRELRTDEL